MRASTDVENSIPLRSPELDKTIYDYSCAILRGGVKGLVDFVELIEHPIDNLIYPISSLVYDAALIYTAYLGTPGIDPNLNNLQAQLQHYPDAYQNAHERMQLRFETIQQAGLQFSEAPSVEKIEMLSQFATGVFLSGVILSDIKTACLLAKNYREFGTCLPPKYHSVMPRPASYVLPEIKYWSLDDIRGITGENNFIYVITEDKKLLIGSRGNSSNPFDNAACNSSHLCHDELSGLKPVYAGGELGVINGKIYRIDNGTGHFLVEGTVRKFVERVFIENGYVEAAGQFRSIPIFCRLEGVNPIKTFSNTSELLRLKTSETVFSMASQVYQQCFPHESHEISFFGSAYAATEIKNARSKTMRTFTDKEIAKFPRFKDLASEIPCGPCDVICPESLETSLRSGKKSEYVYVILDDGRLEISDKTDVPIFHRDLVGENGSVIAAGEIKIEAGECIINNQSGSFRPKGAHIKDYVLSQLLPCFGSSADKVKFEYFQEKNDLRNLNAKPPVIKRDTREADAITEGLNLYRAKADDVVKRQIETNQLLQSKKSNLFGFTESDRTQLRVAAKTLLNFHQATTEVSQLAIHLGGHQQTWMSVAQSTAGIVTIANRFSALAQSTDLFSLANFTNTLGMINAGFSIANALIGGSGNQAGAMMGMIMEAFQAVFSAIQRVHEEILAVKKILINNMEALFFHLNKINSKLDRLEKIVTGSFKELHFTDCMNDIDKIKKDIAGEMILTDVERKDYITRLSTWIEYHLFSGIQTALFRDSRDLSKCVEILSSSDFDAATMLPFLMAQLRKCIPTSVVNIDAMMPDLCNLELNHALCDIYTTAVTHYAIAENNYIPSVMRMKEKLLCAETAINEIRDTKIILEMLIKQHQKARFDVGRMLKKVFDEIPSNADATKSLRDLLPNGIIKEQFLEALNHMEFIRLLLQKLFELALPNNVDLLTQIKNLESTNEILQKPKSFYDGMQNELIAAARENDTKFKACILNGADINRFDSWGQAIHYVLRDGPEFHSLQMLHSLFQCGTELEYQNGTRDGFGSWGSNVHPARWFLNSCIFEHALLWLANGYPIIESPQDFYNGYRWANLNAWKAIVQKYLVKEFNTKQNELQKAYRYYCAFENGFVATTTDVDVQCLLWICCVLGNVDALRSISLTNLDVNQKIPDCDFTPLMMAIVCGHMKIVDFLLSKNADYHASFVTIDPHPATNGDGRFDGGSRQLSDDQKPHLLFIAIEYKQFLIAERLIAAGLKPTAAQAAAIAEGLKTLTPAIKAAPSTSNVVVASQSRASALILETKNKLSHATKALKTARLPITKQQKSTDGEITDSDDDDILQEQTQEFFKASAVPQWEKTGKPGQRVLHHLGSKDRLKFFGALKKERNDKDVFQKDHQGETALFCQLAVKRL